MRTYVQVAPVPTLHHPAKLTQSMLSVIQYGIWHAFIYQVLQAGPHSGGLNVAEALRTARPWRKL